MTGKAFVVTIAIGVVLIGVVVSSALLRPSSSPTEQKPRSGAPEGVPGISKAAPARIAVTESVAPPTTPDATAGERLLWWTFSGEERNSLAQYSRTQVAFVTDVLESDDPQALKYFRTSRAMRQSLARISALNYITTHLQTRIHPNLLAPFRGILVEWASDDTDLRVQLYAAKLLVVLAKDTEGLRIIEHVQAGSSGKAVRRGIAEGMYALARRQDFQPDEDQKTALHRILWNELLRIPPDGDLNKLTQSIGALRAHLEDLDSYLIPRLDQTTSTSARAAIIGSLDISNVQSRERILETARGDNTPLIRAMAVGRLFECLDGPDARALFTERVRGGTTMDRAQVLRRVERVGLYGPKRKELRQDVEWALEMLAQAPETHLREKAIQRLSKLKEKSGS